MATNRSGGEEALPPQLARLPPGRHGLPRDFVASNHRDRLLAACSQQIQERGYSRTTVADIIKTAAVSRRTFYEHFDSKEACFVTTYDLLMEYLRKQVFAAFDLEPTWPEQVRAGLAAMLGFFAEQPGLARLAMVEPLAAGPPVSEHHRQVVIGFSPLLSGGADPASSARQVAEVEEAVVAGLISLITRRIVLGQVEQLSEQLPELVATALTPFLGAAEGERISRE